MLAFYHGKEGIVSILVSLRAEEEEEIIFYQKIFCIVCEVIYRKLFLDFITDFDIENVVLEAAAMTLYQGSE